MDRPEDIIINEFQLSLLFNKREEYSYYYLLDHGVYCTTCEEISRNGIHVEEIHLTELNDIMVKGACAVCGGKVCRTMEFGENEAFNNKANDFRITINK